MANENIVHSGIVSLKSSPTQREATALKLKIVAIFEYFSRLPTRRYPKGAARTQTVGRQMFNSRMLRL